MKYDLPLVRSLELDQIKQYISITDYLAHHGHQPAKMTSKIAWYSAPWRVEKEPSLAVYYRKNPQDWYDFGEHKGGSIIDLAMKLHNISYKETMQRLRAILKIPNMSPIDIENPR